MDQRKKHEFSVRPPGGGLSLSCRRRRCCRRRVDGNECLDLLWRRRKTKIFRFFGRNFDSATALNLGRNVKTKSESNLRQKFPIFELLKQTLEQRFTSCLQSRFQRAFWLASAILDSSRSKDLLHNQLQTI